MRRKEEKKAPFIPYKKYPANVCSVPNVQSRAQTACSNIYLYSTVMHDVSWQPRHRQQQGLAWTRYFRESRH